MNKLEQRAIALGAIRSEARRRNMAPERLSVDDALMILDDIYRVDAQLIASLWYGQASDNQYKLFKREWNKWIEYENNLGNWRYNGGE